jgi:chemotaxis protein methyltransferase CheR
MIVFRRINLLDAGWPIRGPLDVIFCRNVMIYFDKPTQASLLKRFFQNLGRGGVLFIGHSESLAGIEHPFRYVQPATYRKEI